MERIKRKMSRFPRRNQEILKQGDLEDDGLQSVCLRDYQLEGVSWMKKCFDDKHGCILGDEMGLGKTVQTIALLLHLHGLSKCSGPFIVISPLSVLQNWENEFSRFSKIHKVLCFIGDKDEREQLKDSVGGQVNSKAPGCNNDLLPFHVLLTTYEMCLRETTFLRRFHWKVMIVDEAHRLKNFKSVLYQELSRFKVDFSVLLTGTPVQNNLKELYSLLSFVSGDIFSLDTVDEFVDRYADVDSHSAKSSELQELLSPFLLRRVKSEVTANLPRKAEVLLYTGMSEIQKKYYKAILMKDLDAFNVAFGTTKTRLMNTLMHLRKCVNHPYLFDGVEPEPFELGDHLINSSGKLIVIDQLLAFLKARGHKVLMFSQMVRMLDIIQDYLGYRGFSYERLDGSVRGEERYLAIQNFSETEDTFIFLLSTRAGGQGLNLMSADTVIFVDSDFNPQNDLQAAARAHRIGQTRPVKVIRLVARSTVEEIVLKRADDKLKLTNTVIEGGKFSGSVAAAKGITETAMQVTLKQLLTNVKTPILTINPSWDKDMLKFGLDKLFDSEESTITEKDLERILGGSCNNEWIVEEESKKHDNEDITMETNEDLNVSNMYVFEGEDYSKYPSDRDKEAFDKIVADLMSDFYSDERLLRRERKVSVTQLIKDLPVRKRKVLTPQELEERRKKRQENAAKRAKLKEEEQLRKEREQQRKLEKLWKENSYNSLNIIIEEDYEEDEIEENESFIDDEENEPTDIQYVRGDVTHPMNTSGTDAIIVHCVDDSGRWGHGGLFSALSRRSSQPETLYELANQMKDLNLGDTHVVPVDDRESRKDGRDYVALLVAQTRDRHGRLSGILLASLSQGLQRIAEAAKRMKATVHLPRVGYNTPSFNWYGTERLIRKHLASKGIKTSIYYFPRNQSKQSKPASPSPSSESRASKGGKSKDRKATFKSGEAASDIGAAAVTKTLPDFMSGVTALFYNVTEGEKRRLTRFLVAYNGDVSRSANQDVTHVVCGTCGSYAREFVFRRQICEFKMVG